MPNDAMIENWDGPSGEHWVREAERYDRANRRFGERVAAAVAAQPGERILDIGCGNGAVSLLLAEAGAAVVGVDISGPMLAEARRRVDAAGLDNVEFVKADAQVHEFEPEGFDAAVSRFGVMFFDDPVAAFANIGRGLRSGGRLAFACWQEVFKNEWLMVPATAILAHVPMPDMGGPNQPGPFAFADPDRVRSILGEAGFVDVELRDAIEPMRLGDTAEDVVDFFSRTDLAAGMFKDVDEATRAAALADLTEAARPYQTDEGVSFEGVAWLVTARRP